MIRSLICWVLDRRPVRDIYDRAGETVYLRRWHLLGGYEAKLSLMLHRFLRPDEDACHHDHPWTFVTLVLRGGYVEHVTRWTKDVRKRDRVVGPGIAHGETVVERRNPPGTIRVNRAEHKHRIDRLLDDECWTLVLRFPKKRSWGFWTREGWIPWRRFIDGRRERGVAWCEEPDYE